MTHHQKEEARKEEATHHLKEGARVKVRPGKEHSPAVAGVVATVQGLRKPNEVGIQYEGKSDELDWYDEKDVEELKDE